MPIPKIIKKDLKTLSSQMDTAAREISEYDNTLQPSSSPSLKESRKLESQKLESRKPGRPHGSRKSKIQRSKGKTMFFEDRHNELLDMIAIFNSLNRQDVIRCALDIFLQKYLQADNRLSAEGETLVRHYHDKTHI